MSESGDKKTLRAGSPIHRPIVVPPAHSAAPAAVTLSPPFPEQPPVVEVPFTPPIPLFPEPVTAAPKETSSRAASASPTAHDDFDEAWNEAPAAADKSHGPTGTLVASAIQTKRPPSLTEQQVEPKPEPEEDPLALLPPVQQDDQAFEAAAAMLLNQSKPPSKPRPEQVSAPLLDMVPLSSRPPEAEPPGPVDLGPPLLLSPQPSAGERSLQAARDLLRSGPTQVRTVVASLRTRFSSLTPERRRKLVGGVALCVLALPLSVVGIALITRALRPAPSTLARARLALSAAANALAAPAPVETTTPSPTPAGPKGPCTTTGEPKQLAPKISKDVPVELRVHADRAEAALGFVADGRTAAGLVVDLQTLEVRDRYRKGATKIGRVVPLPTDQGFTFEVHAQGRPGRNEDSLTLSTTPPKLVSWKKDELRVAAMNGKETTAWKLEGKPSAVRVLAIPSQGAAIAFRLKDSLQLVWIDEAGQKVGDLSTVRSGNTRLGSPALAWNESEMMIAVAEQESANAPWAVRIARTPFGAPASSVNTWEVPPGGPGGPAIAPSIADLQNGGWLFSWTEGKQGTREVRMQTYSNSLEPVGESRAVSGPGNAGQGVALVARGKGLVVYLVGTQAHELWGVGIECP